MQCVCVFPHLSASGYACYNQGGWFLREIGALSQKPQSALSQLLQPTCLPIYNWCRGPKLPVLLLLLLLLSLRDALVGLSREEDGTKQELVGSACHSLWLHLLLASGPSVPMRTGHHWLKQISKTNPLE